MVRRQARSLSGRAAKKRLRPRRKPARLEVERFIGEAKHIRRGRRIFRLRGECDQREGDQRKEDGADDACEPSAVRT